MILDYTTQEGPFYNRGAKIINDLQKMIDQVNIEIEINSQTRKGYKAIFDSYNNDNKQAGTIEIWK